MIETKLQGKNAKEKANIKAKEIAKLNLNGNYSDPNSNIKIEITSMNEIEGGVEVFARAWKGTKKLGFGKDGSVEIERFRIFNPPVLVDDENGDIVRPGISYITGSYPDRRLREDPVEAIRRVVADNAALLGKEGTNIIEGKVGNTVTTLYSATGANSPVDGGADANSTTWSTAQQATTGASAQDSNTGLGGTIMGNKVYLEGSTWYMGRGIMLFDTSVIGSDTIDSVVLSIWAIGISNSVSTGNDNMVITSSTPASNSAVSTADFDQVGTVAAPTSFSTLALSAMSASQYNAFTFNATGEAAIDTAGITKLGLRAGDDITATPVGFSSTNQNGGDFYSADQTGTANDPKLVVTHTALPAIKTRNTVAIASVKTANTVA